LATSSDQLTGYDTHDRYYATRYSQGARQIYSLDLSLIGIASILPKPDPDNPTPGNRKVDPKHAADFGSYVREKKDWVSPALILRAPDQIFEFEKRDAMAGSEFGILAVPRVARTDLRILDGQHRILGIHLALENIARELDQARQELNAARHGDPEAVDRLEARVKNLLLQRDRFGRERVSVQVVLEDDEKGYKQMFVDIAENAKGITKTIQVRFDNRRVVNRALLRVIQHPLLDGRVEDQLDRVKTDDQLLAAKHVVEIVRAVAVGLSGRISRRKEEELDEAELVAATDAFLDTLTHAFPEFQEIVDGKMAPGDLRRDGARASLLGSATMLRVLAGAYHEMSRPAPQRGQTVPNPMTDQEIVSFLAQLRPYMGVPVTSRLWLDTGVFDSGASAPRARGGDIRRLSEHIVSWARQGLPIPNAA